MEKRERPRTGQRNRCLRCDCGRLRFANGFIGVLQFSSR
jgi:hypothetical protein